MARVLATDSDGLVGSNLIALLDERCWTIHRIDNERLRRALFGERGRYRREPEDDLDIRDAARVCLKSDIRSFRVAYRSWEPEVALDCALGEFGNAASG